MLRIYWYVILSRLPLFTLKPLSPSYPKLTSLRARQECRDSNTRPLPRRRLTQRNHLHR